MATQHWTPERRNMAAERALLADAHRDYTENGSVQVMPFTDRP